MRLTGIVLCVAFSNLEMDGFHAVSPLSSVPVNESKGERVRYWGMCIHVTPYVRTCTLNFETHIEA